ncbi:MAG: hypothetical protein NT140_04695 [Deltaproteobacteria bacterium]|nr:hypothetical protein [Deltaproteobacteria bacterium]
MTKYISGKNLLIHLDIKPFELFHYVKEGHQPLDKLGRPIPPPDISTKLERLKRLCKELDYMPWPALPSSIEKMEQLRKRNPALIFGAYETRERLGPRRDFLLKEIETLKEDLDSITNIHSWAAYELPDDEESAQWVIDHLKEALFETEPEVEKDPQKEDLLPQKKETSGNFFTREGDVWHIGFEGKDTRVKHKSGLRYIAFLLEKPQGSISCINLYQAANKAEANPMSEDRAIAEGLNKPTRTKNSGSINDSKARSALWTRYQKLQGEQAENERDGVDPIIQAEIKKEKDALEKEMRQRTFQDSIHGKAQNNISRAIDRAFDAMNSANMKELSRFLNDHIKPDGKYGYIYTGPPWIISQ